jgi:RNA polymerase sigma-70 factor (ECF subfamily)
MNLTSGQFRGEASLRTYAARVARYTCLEHLRRRRPEVVLDADNVPSQDRWSGPEESFLWTEEHLQNLEIFSSLPRECRELLRMVFVDRLPYREIGLKLGISEGAIKTRVHRCRAAFRRNAGLQKSIPVRRQGGRQEP